MTCYYKFSSNNLYQNDSVLGDMQLDLQCYFSVQYTLMSISSFTVWAAHKCTNKCSFTKHVACLNKERAQEIASFLSEIESLEKVHKKSYVITLQFQLILAHKKHQDEL